MLHLIELATEISCSFFFPQASKAAEIRFYETLRSELGKQVQITILIPGYVESELTKGKALQKEGEVRVNEEARDVCC